MLRNMAGAEPRTIWVPQLEMQPFVPGAAVPGAPVLELVQKSDVVPHWPQTSQHALSRHGLRGEMSTPAAGLVVPGTCGPHTVPATAAGIGGVPVLMQMMVPTQMLLQPFHAHVFL